MQWQMNTRTISKTKKQNAYFSVSWSITLIVTSSFSTRSPKKGNDDPVIDEFCGNKNILSDDNSVCYRFLVKEIKHIGVFKIKVRQSFLTTEVDIFNQLYEISGYENLQDQFKFYLKNKNNLKAIKAIMNLKSENILMRKIPKKRPNS